MPYYPSSCESLIPHSADCYESREFGRIRSAGFIRADYLTATPSAFDPADPQSWQTGIDLGKIILIPETNGDSPKASPRMGPAYGYHGEVLLGYEFSASYDDPNFNSNCGFYNSVVGNLNYVFFYRTSDHVYIADRPATIVPNRDIKNDMTGEVVWSVEVKWISKSFPCGVPAPDGVFANVCCPPYWLPDTVVSGGTGGTGNTGNGGETGPAQTGPCAELLTRLAHYQDVNDGIMSNYESGDLSTQSAERSWAALNDLMKLVEALLKEAIAAGCDEAPYRTLLALIATEMDTLAAKG